MLHAYERGLDLALRWRLTTLVIFFATLGLSVYLFVIIPKGFFPQQDVGLITATSEASQDISFAAMKQRQEALGDIVRADPDVATRGDGDRRQRPGRQQRQPVHHAETARRTRRQRPADHRPAASQARQGRGRPPVHAGRAGRAARRPADAHPVRVHAAGCQSRRAERMGAEDLWARCRRCPSCATSRPTSSPRAPRCSSRSTATPHRATASSRN